MAMLLEVQAERLAQVQQLVEQLMREHAQAERVRRSLEQTKGQNAAKVKALASQNLAGEPVTLEQIRELGQEIGQEGNLARELERVQAQVTETAQALEQAQSRIEEGERLRAQLLARPRMDLDPAEARLRTRVQLRRLRPIASFAWFLLRLMRAPGSLWDGIVRNLYLGMRVIALVAWMLPAADRGRWEQESYGDLEMLKQEKAPLLGTAIRTALRTPQLSLVLRTRAWGRSPAGRWWLARLKPLSIGLGTAAATFLAGAAQIWSLAVASLLAGMVAAWQTDRGRRPRRRRPKRR